MLSGQILWDFKSNKSLNFDILGYLDDKVTWLKYWDCIDNDVDKYSNRFMVNLLSIRDLLRSKNFYLLPLQKNLLLDVSNHLKERSYFDKKGLELLELLEKAKVADWDSEKHLYKTDNGYFKPSDMQKKSFVLKNKG